MGVGGYRSQHDLPQLIGASSLVWNVVIHFIFPASLIPEVSVLCCFFFSYAAPDTPVLQSLLRYSVSKGVDEEAEEIDIAA